MVTIASGVPVPLRSTAMAQRADVWKKYLEELLTASGNLASVKYQYIEAYSAALVYYLVIVSILMALQSRLERRFTWSSRRRARVTAPAVPAISHDAR